MRPLFKGYVTRSPREAAKFYKEKTGEEPTILVVRPEQTISDEHPALIYSHFGAAGVILATHLVDYEDFRNFELAREEKRRITYTPKHEPPPSLDDVDKMMQLPIIQKKPPGRPKSGSGICPHCQGEIQDFNLLGFWWGWEYGIEPPYWEELRLFVFQRDQFTCQNCKKIFGMSGLVPHHIIPKEDGGPDSARNLTTLCQPCHGVNKPIFEDENQRDQIRN